MEILSGKIQSGIGDFGIWIGKLKAHYKIKTGLDLYPGTLNIMLDRPYHLPKDAIRLEKEEFGGTVSVSMQPCMIFNRKAFILRTDKNASGKGVHSTNIIEIATDIKLRDEYNLKDGDEVQVFINA